MKAQGFLAQNGLAVREQVDAGRNKLGRDAALALARQASRILVARGRSAVEFDMKKSPPDEQTLLAHLLGPTGNLRAPTLRKGGTLLVGFNEENYRSML